MTDSQETQTIPRSMRHRRILDVAEENPDASLEAIAGEVPSATADLVERVLDQYGDPATDETAQSESSQGPDYPDKDDLSEKQRETLRTIYEYPEATQRELASILDVSSATVNNRVNAIDGFDWDDRRAFVEAVFGSEPGSDTFDDHRAATNGNGTEKAARIDQIASRLADLERKVDGRDGRETTTIPLDSPELVQKVVHACMRSDEISDDEELQILGALLH